MANLATLTLGGDRASAFRRKTPRGSGGRTDPPRPYPKCKKYDLSEKQLARSVVGRARAENDP